MNMALNRNTDLQDSGGGNPLMERFYYDNQTVKLFGYASVFWGVIGMLAGLWGRLRIGFP